MVVYALETFMTANSLTSPANIGTLAEEFMKSNQRTPILLIDFPSCFGHIYHHASLDKLCGGQIKEFVYLFKKLHNNFEKFGIKCVFFCDGYPPEERLEIWLKRRIRKINTSNAIISALDATRDAVELEKMQEEYNNTSHPATGAWFAGINYLRSVNAQLIQVIREGEEELFSYMKREKCFGVLARDSDFLIPDGVLHVFSTWHLNICTLDTWEYCRDKLIAKLSLSPELLPIFATLCGNDHVFFGKLRGFHSYLLQSENYVRHQTVLWPIKLFPKIVQWINMESRHRDLIKNPEEVAVMIGLPELSSKFAASVKSYLSSAETVPRHELSGNAAWDAIVEETNVKMEYQHQCSKIHSVIVSQVLFNNVYLQFYVNDLYPCDEKVGATLRRKFYGILLKEHPSSKSIKVTEFISSCEEGSQSVAPLFPGNHPGLLSMWSNQGNLLEEKWQLLGWAVGDGVPLNLIRALPEPLQIPTLALFYITHESRMLQQWQASALALQAVLLLRATPFELQKIECICQDGVAVHLATVYQSMCMWVSYVAEACGNPTCLFKFIDYAMFDGKLFHSIYLSFKRLGNFGTYLERLNAEESEFLQQMETVIRR